jgi:hypothetical protein
MMSRTTPTKHRVQFFAAVLVTVGGIYGLSRLIRPATPAPTPVPVVATSQPKPIVAIKPPEPPSRVTGEFLAAVEAGDRDALDKLYRPGMSLQGALGVAARLGKTSSVAWLLEHGADVHEAQNQEAAPVLLADAYPSIVTLLHERGVSDPPLGVAAAAGAPNAVDRILKSGQPNGTAKNDALVAALGSSSPNRQVIVDKLLTAGADANAADGTNPMAAAILACEQDASDNDAKAPAAVSCLGLIASLTKRGGRVTGEALQTALSNEVARDRVLDAVLAAPLEPGATATALGLVDGSVDAAQLKKVAARGVAWSWHDGEADATAPLLSAVERQDVPLVRKLLDVGAPADMHLKDGRSPLGVAIEGLSSGATDSATIAELLVERGASPNRRLGDGRPPLYAAAEAGDTRTVNMLLDHKARINEVVLGVTALEAAERANFVAVARILESRGGKRVAKGNPID